MIRTGSVSYRRTRKLMAMFRHTYGSFIPKQVVSRNWLLEQYNSGPEFDGSILILPL